ncbi:hypothetical protein ACFVUS_28305 [Nocardia sp. NPDC058058]|uniref:DUF6630 family protein n=1 Tax=Nocardia sp. NPDC058058 TaxID=3346317 RepID=UPI0036D8C443
MWMSSQEWDSFAMNLAGVLTGSPTYTVMNLNTASSSLGITKNDDLSLSLSDNVSASGRQYLRDTGWAGPDSDGLWWYRIRETGFMACRDIASAATRVLQLVFEVGLPSDLQVEAWVDAHTDAQVPLGQLRASSPTPVDDEVSALLPVAELLLADYPWLVATVRYRLTDSDHSHDFALWPGLLSVLGEPYFGGLGILAQCDWKQAPDQVRDMLQRLPSHPTTLAWDWYAEFLVSTADWDAGDITEALLDRVGKHCDPLGVALISIETEGDAYAVTFIPLDHVDRLSALTAQVGRRVQTLPFGR